MWLPGKKDYIVGNILVCGVDLEGGERSLPFPDGVAIASYLRANEIKPGEKLPKLQPPSLIPFDDTDDLSRILKEDW